MASGQQPRTIQWKYIVPIIAAIILTSGTIVAAIISKSQSQTIIPPSTATSFVHATGTFPTATTEAKIPTETPTTEAVSVNTNWVVYPTEYHFGAMVTNHEFNEPLVPGQILSLSTEVGQFTVLNANNNPITVTLSAQSDKSYVIILVGDQTGTTPITLNVKHVSSGNIDWEKRTPPQGTQWLPAALAVEERVASGLMMSPNCNGNGCATVGYYILDSSMHILKTSESNTVA